MPVVPPRLGQVDTVVDGHPPPAVESPANGLVAHPGGEALTARQQRVLFGADLVQEFRGRRQWRRAEDAAIGELHGTSLGAHGTSL
jgi:hypothetical protein